MPFSLNIYMYPLFKINWIRFITLLLGHNKTLNNIKININNDCARVLTYVLTYRHFREWFSISTFCLVLIELYLHPVHDNGNVLYFRTTQCILRPFQYSSI